MSDNATPRYDLLRQQRAQCLSSIAAAERCLDVEWLAAHRPTYERLIAVHRGRVLEINTQLAAYPVAPVYAGGRKADLRALMLAFRAKQVTPREFSQRMQMLMGAL